MKKTVLITGAGIGLGASLATKYAIEGYNLILTYLNSEKEILELKKELEKYKINIETYKLDISNEEEVKAFYSNIKELDILINNAATNNDCEWNQKESYNFTNVLNTNITGTYLMIKYGVSLLEKTNGNIINIASTNGIYSMYPESIDYDASKAGIINMTKSLASALAPTIRVNAVAPGWIETEKTKNMNPKFKKREIEKIALKRFARPEEITELIFFLSSNKASYMTGSIVEISGGQIYGS